MPTPEKKSLAGGAASWLYNTLIPKRKTVVRAIIFALLGFLPILLIVLVRAPHVMVPFLALVGGSAWLLGAGEDVSKQLRWMKRMSSRGPIFWAWARIHTLLVRVGRKVYGGKLDALPKAPVAFGTKVRGAEKVTLKWIPELTSSFSEETYEIQVRRRLAARCSLLTTRGSPFFSPRCPLAAALAARCPSADAARCVNNALSQVRAAAVGASSSSNGGWVSLSESVGGSELVLTPLKAGTSYDCRVRAGNTKGHSEWRECAFTTKQLPVFTEEGMRAGGVGPGYRWAQHLKDESLLVHVGPLPAGTRAKQLEVKALPSSLRVALSGNSTPLLSGELHAPITADEMEWELVDLAGSSERELQLSLTKAGKPGGPLWPCLLKDGPEIDTARLKRKEKDLEELMAEISAGDEARGMAMAEEVKKSM